MLKLNNYGVLGIKVRKWTIKADYRTAIPAKRLITVATMTTLFAIKDPAPLPFPPSEPVLEGVAEPVEAAVEVADKDEAVDARMVALAVALVA